MGAVLIIVGFVITGIAGGNTTLIVIGTVIRSLGVGPILSAVFALVQDVVQIWYPFRGTYFIRTVHRF